MFSENGKNDYFSNKYFINTTSGPNNFLSAKDFVMAYLKFLLVFTIFLSNSIYLIVSSPNYILGSN